MITNERQYKITKSEAEKFRQAIREFNPLDLVKDGIDPLIADAQRSAMQSQLDDLEKSLAEYDDLQSGEIDTLRADSLVGLGCRLIEARISARLTQKELAERLGMKAQQIQRYEQEKFKTANLVRLAEIAQALGLEVKVELTSNSRSGQSGNTEKDSLRLPFREMRARGWFDEFSAREDDEFSNDVQLAALYVKRQSHQSELRALHKQTIKIDRTYDHGCIMAWKSRILDLAHRSGPTSFGYDVSDAAFLKHLAQLSSLDDGPLRAVHALKEVGVTVVVERHLPKTYLDGAAMLLDGKHPVIGLTLRHDRLDNFWFVLFHELGHIIHHRNFGLRDGFFDDDESQSTDRFEVEADDFARNALIPDELWKASFVRLTTDESKVVDFAKRLGIHSSIVAGRIRRERDYKLFTNLVGRGSVRQLLGTGADIPGGYDDS